MPDSFPGLFWLCFQAGRPARLEAAELLGPAIDETKVDIGEVYDPVALLGLGDADELADEGFADEDEVAPHLISPLERTRRTAWSASYQGSSTLAR